jgi:hypothetical protein
VVVIKGEDRDDCGRMATVSRRVGSQVETCFRGPMGAWRKKRKAPASLIHLEEGLELITDEDLCPVIRRTREKEESQAPMRARTWLSEGRHVDERDGRRKRKCNKTEQMTTK